MSPSNRIILGTTLIALIFSWISTAFSMDPSVFNELPDKECETLISSKSQKLLGLVKLWLKREGSDPLKRTQFFQHLRSDSLSINPFSNLTSSQSAQLANAAELYFPLSQQEWNEFQVGLTEIEIQDSKQRQLIRQVDEDESQVNRFQLVTSLDKSNGKFKGRPHHFKTPNGDIYFFTQNRGSWNYSLYQYFPENGAIRAIFEDRIFNQFSQITFGSDWNHEYQPANIMRDDEHLLFLLKDKDSKTRVIEFDVTKNYSKALMEFKAFGIPKLYIDGKYLYAFSGATEDMRVDVTDIFRGIDLENRSPIPVDFPPPGHKPRIRMTEFSTKSGLTFLIDSFDKENLQIYLEDPKSSHENLIISKGFKHKDKMFFESVNGDVFLAVFFKKTDGTYHISINKITQENSGWSLIPVQTAPIVSLNDEFAVLNYPGNKRFQFLSIENNTDLKIMEFSPDAEELLTIDSLQFGYVIEESQHSLSFYKQDDGSTIVLGVDLDGNIKVYKVAP